MNWLAYLLKSLTLIPTIVATIEHIHGDAKSGAEKKQLALESLDAANGVALAVLPQDKAMVDAATSLVSTAIDGTVAVMNASKQAPLSVVSN